MKNYIKGLFIAFLLTFLSQTLTAQDGGDPNPLKFWFNVKLYNTINKTTHVKEYQMRLIAPTIYNGSLEDYQKSLWKGVSTASKISVGPFVSWEEANNAMKLYKMVRDTVTERSTSNTCYWFLLKVNIMERSHSYSFERMAARVASGNSSDFSAVLRESLGFKTLAIGPFYDLLEAEQSKMIYRVEE